MTSFELRKNDESKEIIENILELSNNHADIEIYERWYSIRTELKGYVCRDLENDNKFVLHLFNEDTRFALDIDLDNVESIYLL